MLWVSTVSVLKDKHQSMQERTPRTVAIVLFLVSFTEVRSYMPCSQDSDCRYNGCLMTGYQDPVCGYNFGYKACYVGGCGIGLSGMCI
jgi:hypothetical protein